MVPKHQSTDDKKPADDKPAKAGKHSSAVDRLRAFEDERFGKDAPRQDGKVERGAGSPFANMTDKDRRHHAALERLVVTEQNLAAAHAALVDADAAHEAAEKDVADAAASE